MSARTILKHLHQQGRMTDYQFDVINRNLKERPQGEWIMNKTSARGRNYTCTNCHNASITKFCYCGWCGADMRGDKHES